MLQPLAPTPDPDLDELPTISEVPCSKSTMPNEEQELLIPPPPRGMLFVRDSIVNVRILPGRCANIRRCAFLPSWIRDMRIVYGRS